MKRRNTSDWEDIRDPDQIPADVEPESYAAQLPDGEDYVDDVNWQRPPGGDYRNFAGSGQRRSSEELYSRASQKKSERVAGDPRSAYVRRRKRNQLLLRSGITLALVAIVGVLLWAIKGQLDLREDIRSIASGETFQTQENDPSMVVGETNVTTVEPDVTEPLVSVSVEIVGSWADRSPVTESTPTVTEPEATSVVPESVATTTLEG